MFKIKNLFFLIVFIVGCDPSSNSQKKDIDLTLTQTINKITADSFMNQTVQPTVENAIHENGFIEAHFCQKTI